MRLLLLTSGDGSTNRKAFENMSNPNHVLGRLTVVMRWGGFAVSEPAER
jgi:hypothetical protein